MATRSQHYSEAERLLRNVEELTTGRTLNRTEVAAFQAIIQAAQVHATLATVDDKVAPWK